MDRFRWWHRIRGHHLVKFLEPDRPVTFVELPREHDLAPRRWRLPSGEIVAEAYNDEALELLKSDPEEYIRRTRRTRHIGNK